MVSQIPIDPMHLIDLGIKRKILSRISKAKTMGLRPDVNSISEYLLNVAVHVPTEFQRKPRSFKDLNFWKASELRQFILYTGIVALKDNVNGVNDIYYHFLLLHCAYRILSCSKLRLTGLSSAQNLLENLVVTCHIW